MNIGYSVKKANLPLLQLQARCSPRLHHTVRLLTAVRSRNLATWESSHAKTIEPVDAEV